MTTPYDFFHYKDGVLKAEQVALDRIAEEAGTPVYVYSREAFLAPLRELKEGLSGVDSLICFAVKANSNLDVLKLLAGAGAGMDLVSGGELFRALKAGVDPAKIVFSGVGKTPEEMAYALEKNIYSFNVESTAELSALSAVAQKMKRRAPVALRFNPDVDAKTHPYISTGLKKNKFGIRYDEVLDVARHIQEFPGVDFKGISIHIGSQLTSLSPLGDAFAKARETFDELNEILPKPLEFADLGGGLGITYKSERPPSLSKYCQLILKHFGPKSGLKRSPRILIEPGRTLAGNSGALVTQVLYKKTRGKKSFVVVDAGMNDLIRPALYESYHEIVPVKKIHHSGTRVKADIVGPVCESADFFGIDRPFSKAIGGGDLLAILSAGAYGFTMASQYNSRTRPAEVLVEGSSYRVIRERETFEDLIRGEKL
jgi:diaminopimelate decarboxylase